MPFELEQQQTMLERGNTQSALVPQLIETPSPPTPDDAAQSGSKVARGLEVGRGLAEGGFVELVRAHIIGRNGERDRVCVDRVCVDGVCVDGVLLAARIERGLAAAVGSEGGAGDGFEGFRIGHLCVRLERGRSMTGTFERSFEQCPSVRR